MPQARNLAAALAAVILISSSATAQRVSPENLAEAGPFGDLAALFEDGSEVLPDLGRLTIFAPTNEAFARLPEALRQALGSTSAAEARRVLIQAHVVRGWQEEDDLPVEIETVGGDRLVFSYTDGALTLRLAMPEGSVDPAAMIDSRGEEARLLAGSSARAGHLLIHPVDRVLLPAGLSDSLEDRPSGPARLSVARPRDEDEEAEEAEPAAAIARVDDGLTGDIVPREDAAEAPSSRLADPATLAGPSPEAEVLTLDAPSRTGGGESARATEMREDDPTGAPESEETDAGRMTSGDEGAAPGEGGRDLSLTRPVTSVSGLLGSPVLDDAGSDLGEVTDLLMALATGEVETVVIATDTGLLGLGETETRRVPLDRLTIDPLTGEVILRSGTDNEDGRGGGAE